MKDKTYKKKGIAIHPQNLSYQVYQFQKIIHKCNKKEPFQK